MQLLMPPAAAHRQFTDSEKKILARGEVIYNQLCFSCHGTTGKGMPLQGGAPGVTMAPPLSASKTVNGVSDGIINVVLKGLSGPVDGKNYGSQMVPMQNNDDAWVSAITSYVRNNFGNASPFIDVSEVARVRAATKDHNAPWTLDELHAILPLAREPFGVGKSAPATIPIPPGWRLMEKSKPATTPMRHKHPANGSRLNCPRPRPFAGCAWMRAIHSTTTRAVTKSSFPTTAGLGTRRWPPVKAAAW